MGDQNGRNIGSGPEKPDLAAAGSLSTFPAFFYLFLAVIFSPVTALRCANDTERLSIRPRDLYLPTDVIFLRQLGSPAILRDGHRL